MFNIDRIRALAKEKGIKLGYITSVLGVSHTYFADVKNKKLDIPDERLKSIANILNTTPEYLRYETDDPSRSDKPAVTDDDLKVALFGGDKDVTDEMWQEVLNFAEYVKNRKKNENDNH